MRQAQQSELRGQRHMRARGLPYGRFSPLTWIWTKKEHRGPAVPPMCNLGCKPDPRRSVSGVELGLREHARQVDQRPDVLI